MKTKTNPATPVTFDQLVSVVAAHLTGGGCICSAYGESECVCPNVDWRSRREVALTTALQYCLKKLNAHHRSRLGIPETIRNTEAIRDAGNYRTNVLAHPTPVSGDENILPLGVERMSEIVRLLAVAQPVMEAWAKSHELDEWHCRCETLIGAAYPRNLCPVCCVESSINWRDGKPYCYCPDHGELDDLYSEPNVKEHPTEGAKTKL